MRNPFKRKQAITVIAWCNWCSSEPAKRTVEMEIENDWVALDVGKNCLTQFREAGKIW